MNPLTLKLKCPPDGIHSKGIALKDSISNSVRWNLFGLTPNHLRSLSVQEIARLPLSHGHSSQLVGDLFEVIEGSRETLLLEGDLSHCDCVGGGLQSGQLIVTGSVGNRLAEEMIAGSLIVRGNVGRFAGSNLRGGQVVIQGDAGQNLAGAPPGGRYGMRGGRLIVVGNVQSWAAARMRRGTVVICGYVAGGLAMRMIAGNVFCCGPVDPQLGCGMRRGSLLVLHDQQDWQSIPGFTAFETQSLSFLPMFLESLRTSLPHKIQSRLPPAVSMLPRKAQRAIGDRCIGGLGEVIRLSL